jgi:uncharacterized protein YndB with AHSA1/START domain
VASDGSFEVVSSTQIDAPAERVYPLIANFKNWTQWSPWEGLDPNLEREYSGAESGVGSKYAWKGNRKAGSGSMEIIVAEPPSRIEIDLHFVKPFDAQNITVFELSEAAEGGTTVTWRMNGKHKGFMKLMSKIFKIDKAIEKDFVKGLAKLKSDAESPA